MFQIQSIVQSNQTLANYHDPVPMIKSNPGVKGQANYGSTPLQASPSTKLVTSHLTPVGAELTAVHGFSAIPNVLLDQLRGSLGRNEYDVFMYIVRRTLCFHKLSDAISMSQFQNGIVTRSGRRLDYGCGIKGINTISRAIKALETLGFISRTQTQAANGAATSNLYTLHPHVILEQIKQAEEVEDTTVDTITELPREAKAMELPEEPVVQQTSNVMNFPQKTVAAIIPMQENITAVTSKESTPSNLEGYSASRGQGLYQNGGDKIIVFQNKTKQNKTMHGTVVDSSNFENTANLRVQLDIALLTSMGFDYANAMRLASLSQSHHKPDGYVADIISYCLKHATRNPAGMVRRLIEQGEERQPGQPALRASQKLYKPLQPRTSGIVPPTGVIKQFSNKTFPAVGNIPTSIALCDYADGSKYAVWWQEVCQKVEQMQGKDHVAEVLRSMKLAKVDMLGTELRCEVEPEAAWQARLFTAGALALVELALRQKFGRICKLEFKIRTDC